MSTTTTGAPLHGALAELLEQAGPDVTIRIGSTRQTAGKKPKSRRGKKMIAAHVEPDVTWQIRKLALDRQTTVQALMEEAIGDLFEKHHLPRLLPT